MNDYRNNEVKDEILQELWEAKDYYSLTCNSNFKELVKKVQEDIKKLDVVDETFEPKRMCAS